MDRRAVGGEKAIQRGRETSLPTCVFADMRAASPAPDAPARKWRAVSANGSAACACRCVAFVPANGGSQRATQHKQPSHLPVYR